MRSCVSVLHSSSVSFAEGGEGVYRLLEPITCDSFHSPSVYVYKGLGSLCPVYLSVLLGANMHPENHMPLFLFLDIDSIKQHKETRVRSVK